MPNVVTVRVPVREAVTVLRGVADVLLNCDSDTDCERDRVVHMEVEGDADSVSVFLAAGDLEPVTETDCENVGDTDGDVIAVADSPVGAHATPRNSDKPGAVKSGACDAYSPVLRLKA